MTSTSLHVVLARDGQEARPEKVSIEEAVVAGWTGRDQKAVEKHIAELAAIGVKRPRTTPVFYRMASRRLTTDGTIEVVGASSSGEVEFVILKCRGALWIGVGSDHTDRAAETYDVHLSKQLCEKPVAPTFWAFDDVMAHWDELILRSFAIRSSDERVLYQEGHVNEMLAPETLIARFCGEADAFRDRTLMFCGTLPAIGAIQPANRFEFELEDPVRKRVIRHGYTVAVLAAA